MKSKLSSVILVFVFMSFIATPTIDYAFSLDIDTSICFQISEEEQDAISKIDFKQIFKENSVYFTFDDDISRLTHLFYKEINIKYFALATISPPPEGLS
jgi:hypothetical protein